MSTTPPPTGPEPAEPGSATDAGAGPAGPAGPATATSTPPTDDTHDTAANPAADAADTAAGPRVTRDDVRALDHLRRSRSERRLAGVAGGIARHLDVDPLLVRVLIVVLTFVGGAGALAYAALWLVVPEEGSERATVDLEPRVRSWVVAGAGLITLLSLLGDSWGGWGFPWPLLVVGLVVLLFLGRRPQPSQGTQTPPASDPGWTAPTSSAPAGTAAWPVAPPRPVDPRRRGPILFWVTLALAAVVCGVVAMADAAGLGIGPSAYPAAVLATTGVMLLVGSVWGRAGGLILIGVVATVVLAITSASSHFDDRERFEAPTSAGDVDSEYWLPAGRLVVDLSDVDDVEALDGRTVSVGAGVGRIEVVVPEGMDVTVQSTVGMGEQVVLGDRQSGGDLKDDAFVDSGDEAPDMKLEVSVGLGEIEVTQR